MTDKQQPEDGSNWKTSARGEQAWKELTDGIASRNAETRKAGKSSRAAYERTREEVRRAGMARQNARLRKR